MTRRHLGLGALASLIVQVAPLVAVTILSVVVARRLGPSGTGTIALLLALFEVLVALFGFGLTTGITYLTSRGDWSARHAFRESQLAAGVLGTIGIGRRSSRSSRSRTTRFLRASHCSQRCSPSATCRSASPARFTAPSRSRANAMRRIPRSSSSERPSCLAVAVPLTFFWGLNGALGASQSASVWPHAPRRPYGRSATRALPGSAGACAAGSLEGGDRFGSKAWGATLLQLINYRLDLFLLARSRRAPKSAATRSRSRSPRSPGSCRRRWRRVIFPRTADLHAAQARGEIAAEESDRRPSGPCDTVSSCLLPRQCSSLYSLSAQFRCYTARRSSRRLVRPDSDPRSHCTFPWESVSAVITGRGRPHYALWTTAITVPLTIVLYLALIPILGAYGAALGSTVSYLASTVLGLIWFKRTTHTPVAGGAGALARRAPRLCDCAERCPPSPAPEGRLGVATVAVEPLPWCPACGETQRKRLFVKDGWPIGRCAACTLVYVDASLDREAIDQIYSRDYYEGTAFADYLGERHERLESARDRVRRLGSVVPGGRLLDLGCAMGFFLEAASASLRSHRRRGFPIRSGVRARRVRASCVHRRDLRCAAGGRGVRSS